MRDRPIHLNALEKHLRADPVVGLLGARQVGKTTLARELAKRRRGAVHFFDLESSADLARLTADPLLALSPLRGLVVLDEIQRLPEVFPTLRVLADRPRSPARFLVLGSASPELLRQSSETLAGRISYHSLPGFTLPEIPANEADRLWLRGGFPRAFTARSHADSLRWRNNFIRSFLERDLGQLGIPFPSGTMDRFWAMLAHGHGQLWNGSELGRAFGVSHHAARRYLEALESTFMVRCLKPWHANLRKRQVKSPKIYFRDTGLLHCFLGVSTREELERHPKVGASWEGFIIENLIQILGAEERQCYFWATHTGAEIDLVVQQRGRLRGFEIKRTAAPKFTRSMRSALDDLQLSRIDVIHAGEESFPLARRVQAVSADRMLEEIQV
ncbi:MAG: ATP-binding protein [Gammaproteobacteria bacterium]|nr:ATP-binding protein [Gammaproteobacteria bacterium]